MDPVIIVVTCNSFEPRNFIRHFYRYMYNMYTLWTIFLVKISIIVCGLGFKLNEAKTEYALNSTCDIIQIRIWSSFC